MCFDGNGNRLIMYGGVSPTPSVILNETWAYNGTAWTLLSPLGGAPNRWGHQMVRSTVLNRLVTFGGRSPTISGFANDSYQWNGSVWSVIPASNPPPPRYLYGMAYDSGRNIIVVFGGRGSLATLGDTWELTNNGVTWSWQQILTPTSPPPREEMVMAYMPDLRRTVMFGGYDRDTDTIYGDTWDYDGATWHAVTPLASPTPPLPRGQRVRHGTPAHHGLRRIRRRLGADRDLRIHGRQLATDRGHRRQRQCHRDVRGLRQPAPQIRHVRWRRRLVQQPDPRVQRELPRVLQPVRRRMPDDGGQHRRGIP
jgi:hypothetical protein